MALFFGGGVPDSQAGATQDRSDWSARFAAEGRSLEAIDRSHAARPIGASGEHPAILIANRDRVIEYANTVCAGVLGCTLDDVLGRPERGLQPDADEEPFDRDVWAIVGADRVYRGPFMHVTPYGETCHVNATITPLKDRAGNVAQFVAVIGETTARTDTEHALRRLNASLEQQARRIAQALHDDAGQFVTAAHIAVDDLSHHVAPPARDRLDAVRQQLDAIEGELRRLAHEIRPRILDDLGLAAALQFLAAGVERRRGVAVTVDASLGERLPPLVETIVYRVVQEALNNAGRHGRAHHIAIAVEHSARQLRCRVEDDGVGFDTTGGAPVDDARERGFGLHGIRQQVELIGGTVAIDSAAGRGTRLTAVIPVEG